jgi:hypothetical protein
MASVEIPLEHLQIGDVPAISVKTGRPCANPVAMRFHYIRAVLPIEPERARLHRAFVWAGWPLLAIELIFLFVQPIVTGIGLLLYVLLYVLDQALWIGAKAGTEKGMVLLTRVHPAFAAAVEHGT